MREIIFRGKRVDNGEWVEGFYSEFPIPSLGCMLATGTDEYIACEDTRPHIVKIITKQHPYFSNANPIQVWEYEKYEVIPETVGQYTGLTDKNGKKIFEGDIVENKNENHALIGWDVTDGYTSMLFIGRTCNSLYRLDKYQSQCVTIIGNIHDNPELL